MIRTLLGPLFGAGSLLVLAGCPGTMPGTMTPVDTSPSPGKSFSTAARLNLDATGSTAFSNSVRKGDANVFDLGALVPGDRVTVSVKPSSGSKLDPVAAIFDADQNLFTINDDVDTNAQRFESFIDEVIRYPSDHYYVAISASFFSDASGAYDASVQVAGGSAFAAENQVVFLNFAGGTANVPNVGSFNLPAFDAAKIDTVYSGQTANIKKTILEVVRSNFAGMNLTILNSDDNARPAGQFSEVFFGGFNQDAFGISQQVDHWNRDKSDRSIIFTNRFDEPFSPRPSAAGIGVAIGNVTSHEIGHLLGLEHVGDITDLMDTTGAASTLLQDQNFKQSNLDASVFPIGKQDGRLLLLSELGPG